MLRGEVSRRVVQGPASPGIEQGLPAPQTEGLLEVVVRGVQVAVAGRLSPLLDTGLEGEQVEIFRLDGDEVSVRLGLYRRRTQIIGGEQLAERVNLRFDVPLRGGRRGATPQRLRQMLNGCGRIGPQEERRQKLAMFETLDVNGLVLGIANRQATEYQKCHGLVPMLSASVRPSADKRGF